MLVCDSNAILVYLAEKFDQSGRWLPKDAFGQAAMQTWLSVAAGQISNGPAAARLITVFGAKLSAQDAIAQAHQLLQVMEGVLAQHAFLVADAATLADIAAYSYVAAAPEGNVDLSPYAKMCAPG